MDRPQGLRSESVDRTPYGAFGGMVVVVITLFVAASWLLGLGIARAKQVHLKVPGVSLPAVSAPDVGSQVQSTLQDAADKAAKSAVDSAAQAAKDEAAKQAQDAQKNLQNTLQNNLK